MTWTQHTAVQSEYAPSTSIDPTNGDQLSTSNIYLETSDEEDGEDEDYEEVQGDGDGAEKRVNDKDDTAAEPQGKTKIKKDIVPDKSKPSQPSGDAPEQSRFVLRVRLNVLNAMCSKCSFLYVVE